MDSISGRPKEVFETILGQMTDPVATLPKAGLVRDFVEAVDEHDDVANVRALVAQEALDRLTWPTKGRAIDLRQDATLALRRSTVDDVVIAGREKTATLDCSLGEPVALIGEEPLWSQYHGRWMRGSRVEFDVVSRNELVDAAEETVGPDAAEAITTEIGRDFARGGSEGPDPIKLLLWGAAVAGGRVVEVQKIIKSLDMGSRERVEYRLEDLKEDGFLVTPPAQDGTRGRPERLLAVDVDIDDPMRPPDWVRARFV
jgi:hypothetical protein